MDKKKNKINFRAILGFIVSCFIGGIIGGYIAKNLIGSGLKPWVFFILLGIVYLWILIEINIHEFGHYIFGKMSKYKLLRYSIGPLNWQYENGNMKFKMERNKGYSGLCAMVPRGGIDKKQHMLFIAGGVLMNIVSLIPLIIGNMLVEDTFWSIVFTVMILVTLFLILLNAVPIKAINPSTDGNVFWGLLGDKPSAIISVKLLNMSAEMANGVRPRDLGMNIDESFEDNKLSEMQYNIMRVFKALDMNNIDDINENIEFIEDNLDVVPIFSVPPFLYELIYYYSAIDLNEDKAKEFYDRAEKGLIKDKDTNGRRVLAAYKLYIEKDKGAAKQLCEEGLKVIDAYPIKGQALLENDLINRVIEECIE